MTAIHARVMICIAITSTAFAAPPSKDGRSSCESDDCAANTYGLLQNRQSAAPKQVVTDHVHVQEVVYDTLKNNKTGQLDGTAWGKSKKPNPTPAPTPPPAPAADGCCVGNPVSGLEWDHFHRLNALRAAGFSCPKGSSYASNNVALVFDCKLWRASQLHSQDMAAQGYFDHTSQNPTRSPWERASAQGAKANGENIAAGSGGAQAVLDQWQGSDGHCKNMGNADFTVFAVGYGAGGPYRHYWTQMFSSWTPISDVDRSCYPAPGALSSDAIISGDQQQVGAGSNDVDDDDDVQPILAPPAFRDEEGETGTDDVHALMGNGN